MKNALKRSGWTFAILIGALVITTVLMLVGNGVINAVFYRPNWRRIEKDIGVKKGETYPTEFVGNGFEPDPEWGFTAEDIRTAWQNGVRELSKDGELYFLEVKFNARDYNDFDPENEYGQIWYICKIYVGYVEPGFQGWADNYSTTDAFSFCMEKDATGEWQMVNHGFA
ncbi:hypothetical protein SAMN02910447_00329 [Ruminococcus sp. YE71]|uniref:hypothetical protein n=1 Tax=unclassified Ruminococcus TaxID=2608920 RepID=UPI000886B91A|nr:MULTISPECIES: hypothetical protein [unclassified Ruminococcus]SDA09252.1 hypothetical protein SAMN02910446_00020 [Ruminococcus sp. YE78]SFW12863.1 hypothetical protein SAMN02910447_00329 [Ruminococcus sp. YE71]